MKYFKYTFYFIFIFIMTSSCEIENNPVQIISLTASDSIISVGSTITLFCIAEDEDEDKLRYSWESSSGTIISGNKDSAIWNAPSKTGYHTITCKVSDDNGSSDALGISIRVLQNRTPIAYDDTIETIKNLDYDGILSANDPDRDPLVFSIITQPNNGSVIIKNDSLGSFTYTPLNGFTGVDSFLFSASDGALSSNEATVNIIVNEISGTIQGTITNAINGNPISNVNISIKNMEAITNENGFYTIYTELASGLYEVNTSSDQFCPYNGAFQISDDYESNIFIFNFSLSPIPETGEVRMVLNWSEQPSDLDSHLKTPQIEGQEYHIYYGNRGNSDTAPYATLDYDVVTGYGPETMSIKQSFSGNYIYYIYQYSSSGNLNESGASIQIYNSPDCSGETIYVPIQGNGRYWYVCNIDGDSGEINVINQIQESEPTQQIN